jgi:hypothetical protein
VLDKYQSQVLVQKQVSEQDKFQLLDVVQKQVFVLDMVVV